MSAYHINRTKCIESIFKDCNHFKMSKNSLGKVLRLSQIYSKNSSSDISGVVGPVTRLLQSTEQGSTGCSVQDTTVFIVLIVPGGENH